MKSLFKDYLLTCTSSCGVSEESCLEEILHQAEGSEKEYDWPRAAELYEKALGPSAQMLTKIAVHVRHIK